MNEPFTLSSSAFEEGEAIPSHYTCEGENISPPLNWTIPPERTSSLALICEDPDAPGGTWVHWLAFELPEKTRMLPENVPAAKTLSKGGFQGRNDFGHLGYGGPCPPPGPPHRYFFKLYALDTKLDLAPGANRADLWHAMKDHILGEASLMGTFQRD